MAENNRGKAFFGDDDFNIEETKTAEEVTGKGKTMFVEKESKKKPARRRTIKRETKSKRVNLLIRPSDYEALVVMAESEEVSLNELINRFIQDNIK